MCAASAWVSRGDALSHLCNSGRRVGRQERTELLLDDWSERQLGVLLDAVGDLLDEARARLRAGHLQQDLAAVRAHGRLAACDLRLVEGAEELDQPGRPLQELCCRVLDPKLLVRHACEVRALAAPVRPFEQVAQHHRNAACRHRCDKARGSADVAGRAEAEARLRHHSSHALVLGRAAVVLPARRAYLVDERVQGHVALGRERLERLECARWRGAVGGLADDVAAHADLNHHVLVPAEHQLSHLTAHPPPRAAHVQPTRKEEQVRPRCARRREGVQCRLIGLVAHVEGAARDNGLVAAGFSARRAAKCLHPPDRGLGK
mmetsp:Transcript_19739/g.50989  ORF Transcript_19739/g.50989 Transcript_19739/m.50989 type:complete len:319 (-) Transcript_19739:173-1129(-)